MKAALNRLVSVLVGSSRTGIHPPPAKAASLRSVLMDMPVPPVLHIPLQQHQGPAAIPVVKPGDYVLKGQLLATAADDPGLPVHASSSGTIEAIGPHPFPDADGSRQIAITLRADGQDHWLDLQPVGNDWSSLTPAELLVRIQQAGIAGLGGAGFPAHRKLAGRQPVELLIINAVECEPYITADEALLREHARDVVSGARILHYITGAARCVIVTSRDKPAAIAALRRELPDSALELRLLTPRYPLGSEQQLVRLLSGREIPTGGLPRDIGVLVQNVGTAKAVHDAIVLGRPLISRVTTVCGDTVRTPKNFRALIGTPVGILLQLCGTDPQRLHRLVMGGPLMGIALRDLQAPVIKTTNCLIAGSAGEFPDPPPPQPCIRCDLCVPACPVNLMPQLLFQAAAAERLDHVQRLGVQDCIECGACAYVCPSHLPLVEQYRSAKSALALDDAAQQLADHRRQRYAARKQRLVRDAALRRGSRRRSVARPENPDVADAGLQNFSRQAAQREIADAVARVKARKRRTQDGAVDGNGGQS